MGLFGPTVRDFSKSQEGRTYLESLFHYNSLPKPNVLPVPSADVLAKAVLGRATEYLLQLVIERQNPSFQFEVPIQRRFRDARTRGARAIKHYVDSGELTDNLVDHFISLSIERQKTFKGTPSRSKRVVKDGLVMELHRIHDLASARRWAVKNFFYRGWITAASVFTAEADLVIDATLIEVKTTEDDRRHDEHLSQLFSYFLLSLAPTKKPKPFMLGELGIYYARHGVLAKQNVSELARFPLSCGPRIAFDFLVEFSQWRTTRLRGGSNGFSVESINSYAMLDVVRELYPRPEWATRILADPFKEVKNRSGCYVTPRQISIPEDFLL